MDIVADRNSHVAPHSKDLMHYRAFLSYSHKDRKWARWLHRALESYRPPRTLNSDDKKLPAGRLSPIFRDRDELPSTASLSDAVNEALAASEWLIVICSPQAAASHWVNDEIRTFRKLGRSHKILSFVVDGVPESTGHDGCFPAALIEPEQNGGVALEPVAADARPGADGRKIAMLKIAAGMLGVGFDALRQRDLRRRHQRMVAISFGSFAMAAVTIVLAINAVIARNEAELRRTQAEDLIDFMLGDLPEQLREIGRLDVFQSVGDKALEYFAAQSKTDDNKYTLSQRARNLRQIGDVRMEQGDLTAALIPFTESVLITERLASAAPDSPAAQIGWANSMFYVGYVHWQRGDLSQATEYFEKVAVIVDRVSAKEPDNPAWLVEKAYAHTNLGRVLEQKNELQNAHAAYSEVMKANQRLVLLEPEKTDWELELGFAHNNLGKLLVALGQLQGAESHYRNDLAIKERFHANNSTHNGRRVYLAVSQYFLGQLLIDVGALEESTTLLTTAKDHFEYLRIVDPERPGWAARLASIERELGRLYSLKGDKTLGTEYFDASIQTFDKLSKSDGSNFGWRRDLVRSLIVAADADLKTGATQAATRKIANAEVHLAILLKQEPINRETQELSLYADICLAQLISGHDLTVRLQATLDKLEQHFAQTTDPRILDYKAWILGGLSRNDEAEMIRKNLRALGYQGRSQTYAQNPPGSG